MLKFSIRTLLIMTLLTACGVAVYQQTRWNYRVFSASDESGNVLLERLKRTRGIRPDHKTIQNWDTPNVEFRVHIDRNDTPTVTDASGNATTGIKAVKSGKQFSSAFVDSSFVNVLLTSDTDGWNSPAKKQVLEIVSEPGIRIFAVDVDPGENKETVTVSTRRN